MSAATKTYIHIVESSVCLKEAHKSERIINRNFQRITPLFTVQTYVAHCKCYCLTPTVLWSIYFDMHAKTLKLQSLTVSKSHLFSSSAWSLPFTKRVKGLVQSDKEGGRKVSTAFNNNNYINISFLVMCLLSYLMHVLFVLQWQRLWVMCILYNRSWAEEWSHPSFSSPWPRQRSLLLCASFSSDRDAALDSTL